MANELAHATVGTTMTQAEFEAVGLHVFNSQATGDLPYASSTTQLSRLAIGASNTTLQVVGGLPAWVTNPIIVGNLQIDGTFGSKFTTAFLMSFLATPTVARSITFPDATGTVLLKETVGLGANVYASGAQTTTTGAWFSVLFDSETFDTDTIHSVASNTHRLTATTAGKYLIIGEIEWAANATGQRDLQICLNGAPGAGTQMARVRAVPHASLLTMIQISCIYDLAATNWVGLYAFQNSGGDLAISSLAWFSMIRLGA